MRRYEMMIILDPSLEERTVQPSLDQFLTVVTSAGGTIDKVDVWGRRRLAYEIDKKAEGIYTVVDLVAEPETHSIRTDLEYPMAAGDTQITIIGNLVDDPQLRYTPTGQAVANFRVASTPRFLDRQTNEWKDGDSLFLTCNVWRQAAENVAESLQRGMRVIVSGRLRQRSYETKEGEKRTVYEIEVDEVGPSLRNASAKVVRSSRATGQGGGSGGGGGYGSSGGSRSSDDPWASEPADTSGFSDEPPF
jgi:single-strand DNA-binding protein